MEENFNSLNLNERKLFIQAVTDGVRTEPFFYTKLKELMEEFDIKVPEMLPEREGVYITV
jgi:predicted DNA-binding ribbon-helix-helix protein